jgi:hypothetical protein
MPRSVTTALEKHKMEMRQLKADVDVGLQDLYLHVQQSNGVDDDLEELRRKIFEMEDPQSGGLGGLEVRIEVLDSEMQKRREAEDEMARIRDGLGDLRAAQEVQMHTTNSHFSQQLHERIARTSCSCRTERSGR